jgi:hypothetical protein
MFSLYVLVILVFVLYIAYYNFELVESYDTSVKTRTIADDGFCVLFDKHYSDQTHDYPCIKLQKDILSRLPEGYTFIDYFYKIEDVALSTFHRDVTSSQRIYDTTYPVYTVILYKYDGELLSLCPGSHTSYPFVLSQITNINGKAGTVFLFDCDVLHAGRLNMCKKREIVQYKVCHKDDLKKLGSLAGTKVVKKGHCEMSFYNSIMRKLSYFFELPINSIFYPLMIRREKSNSLIGKIQSYIPIEYYNNTK